MEEDILKIQINWDDDAEFRIEDATNIALKLQQN